MSLVPRVEALALPCKSKRATPKTMQQSKMKADETKSK